MPREINTTVYSYKELGPNSKKRAIEDYQHSHDNVDEFWDEFTKEKFIAKAKAFGMDEPEIAYSGFCSQGDGASIFGKVDVIAFVHAIGQAHKWLWLFDDSIYGHDYALITSNSMRYFHENTMDIQWHEYPNADIKWVAEWVDADCTRLADLIIEKFRDMARTLYQELNRDYTHVTSDEAVEEQLIENDYEFYSNGKRFTECSYLLEN